MPFTLTSLNKSAIQEDGGQLLIVTGTFEAGQPYQVHIGPNGDATDPICYSGVPGRPTIVFPFTNNTTLEVYTPLIDPGGPYDVYVTREDIVENDVLAASLTVTKRDYQTHVFDMRSVLPIHYATGPRNMRKLKPV